MIPRPLITTLTFAVIGFLINKSLFSITVPKVYEEAFVYPITSLYIGFGISSFIIVMLLNQVKKRSIDNVGYTYLLLTTLKMMIAYLFLRPILETNLPKTQSEKITFFVVFIYFLAIETIVTIRILNNKQ